MSPLMFLATSRTGGPFVAGSFATRAYAGTSGPRSITNGLDYASRGGLVITRRRDAGSVGVCSDTVIGANNGLYLGSNAALSNLGSPTAYASGGYTLGNVGQFNSSGTNYVSWGFRRGPRFLDIVAFTADGNANQRVAHSLGVTPGMVLLHATNQSSPFYVYNKGMGRSYYGDLSSSAAFVSSTNVWGTSDPTATDIGVNASTFGMLSGTQIIMYLFADDTSAKGMIRGGTFNNNASGSATVTLGWQPQLLLLRLAGGTSNWECFDTTRGWASGTQMILNWNGSDGETNSNSNIVLPTSTGFQISGGWVSSTLAYMAVRKEG